MDLLKSVAEFEEWKEHNIFHNDTADDPTEYPCYARTVVQNWRYEEERAVYLYRSDLEKMLADMEPSKC